ncbi:hypothetical protein [Paenibacillus durus]|uniref:hypothetical protein n=1 Tax=Paenibacillus durus TaxID=44251 RepID=UPI0012E06E03|nr:hypothetical protein [Paenibacillus durus]
MKLFTTKKFKTFVVSSLMCFTLAPSIVSAHSYVGGIASISDVTSAQSAIYTPATYPTINTSPSGSQFSSSWVMVSEQYSSTPGDLFQVGWAHEPEISYVTYPLYFVASIVNGHYSEVRAQVGPAKGSTHTYKAYISGSNWVGMVDNTSIGTLPVSGVSPDTVQYCAEISDDPMYTPFIGTNSDRMKFSSVRYTKSGSSTLLKPSLGWVNQTGSGLYKDDYDSSGYFTTWNASY